MSLAPAAQRHCTCVDAPLGSQAEPSLVTDKKFPGNPTRSYRSLEPLRVIGELETWELFDVAYIVQLKERVRAGMGPIIN
ncbi:NAD(+)--rifampin ADP-ribosyltransferase [Variovorax sp. H27-G14]|uniref:NAD(+)--rifampin ADP-ribosyltransferase n=1 Tax=Variovorax sp. H27-G14 TaxID=3111914 RepID=UPI0038FCBDF9